MIERPWTPDLHLRLARRDARQRRAHRAAVAAAVAAAAGWVASLAAAPHAALVLGAAVVAAAVPLRARDDEAWRTIAEQAGLAYQTHVEHRDRADPHGLLAAAAVQARLSIRGVEPPRRSAWWLPLAAVAASLWLAGALVGGPFAWRAGVGGDAGGPPATSSGPPPAAPVPATADDGVDEGVDDGATEAVAPDLGDDVDADGGPGGREPAPPGDAPGGAQEAGERDALDRFLDGLRERPAPNEPRAEPGDAARDGLQGRDDDLIAAEMREAGRDDEGGDGDPGAANDPATEAGEQADTTVELPTDGVGEGDPNDAGEAGEGGEGPDGPDAEAPGEDGTATGPPDGGDDGEVPAAADDEGPGDAVVGADQPGFDDGMGDDAGVGTGPAAPAGADALPEPGGELEALPGILGPGPETVSGQVLLQGREGEVVPSAAGAAQFERAVEQAVTDGGIPVSYQEIIRNYFR